jgi:hypothetical protein
LVSSKNHSGKFSQVQNPVQASLCRLALEST